MSVCVCVCLKHVDGVFMPIKSCANQFIYWLSNIHTVFLPSYSIDAWQHSYTQNAGVTYLGILVFVVCTFLLNYLIQWALSLSLSLSVYLQIFYPFVSIICVCTRLFISRAMDWLPEENGLFGGNWVAKVCHET